MSVGNKKRFEVFKRDNFTCQYCGRKVPDVVLEVDHICPASKGGKDDLINLVTSCFECNRGKRDGLLGDKLAPIAESMMIEAERAAQLKSYNRLLSRARGRFKRDVRRISDEIISRNGKDPELWGICGTVLQAVEQFLKRMPVEKVSEAAEVAQRKFNLNDRNFTKYFAGVCWHMIRGGYGSNATR